VATNVFVSYRRADTRDFAGRLADRLRASPGIGEVFIDVGGIEPGADFPLRIERALADSEVCLVVMGADWVGPGGPNRGARIHDEGDFVRLEVRRALGGESRVLPILAHGARMPRPEELPEEIRALARINAVTIGHDSFDRDTAYLIDVILQRRKPSSLGAYLRRHPVQAALLRALAGFGMAGVTLVLGAAVLNAVTGKSLDQLLGGSGPVLLVILLVLAAGALVPSAIGRSGRAP
jgi:hypothetical protein